MSKPIKDGGPAFPVPMFESKDGALTSGYDGYGLGGMTMRDYFAARALEGELASQTEDANWPDKSVPNLVKRCYEIADAMLDQRDQP